MIERRERLVEGGLVTIQQAAAFLGIGRTLIYSLMERGELPSVKLGKRRLIPKAALTALASERLVDVGLG